MTWQEKLSRLVDDLVAGTTQGTIKWTETADEDSFRAVLNAGLVRIERGSGGPTQWSDDRAVYRRFLVNGLEYSLLVLDERNKEIARYTAGDDDRAQVLYKLWELASRSARNADQKIDSLLQEVESRLTVK